MPQILDPGNIRLSNADVLAWIASKRAQTKTETASDKASGLPKSFLADNFQRSLRKHERELASRKYPYTDNPGAYSGENRVRAISVFSAQVDKRIVFPAEDALRVQMKEEGKEPAVVEKAVQALWEKKALTETEHLQVYNLAPNAIEMLQNFLVDWEDRFSGEEMDELVKVVGEVYRCGERMLRDDGMEVDGDGQGDGAKRLPITTDYKQGLHDAPMAERQRPSSQAPVPVEDALVSPVKKALAEIFGQSQSEAIGNKRKDTDGPQDFAGEVTIARRKVEKERETREKASKSSSAKQPSNPLDHTRRSSTSPRKRSSPVKQPGDSFDEPRRSSTSPWKRSSQGKQPGNTSDQTRRSSPSSEKRTTRATTRSQTSNQSLPAQQASGSQHPSSDGEMPHSPFDPPRAPAAYNSHQPHPKQQGYPFQHPSSDRPAPHLYSDPPHRPTTSNSDPAPQADDGDVNSTWHERLQRSSIATLKAMVPLPDDEPSGEETARLQARAVFEATAVFMTEQAARRFRESGQGSGGGDEDRYTGITTGYTGPKNANATPLGERKKKG